VLGTAAAAKIQAAGQIVFHVVGDTGGIQHPEYQFAVADAMASDVAPSGVSLFYHLGDVVYYFGQEQYYFEQFYDPYRNYNAPIFAIPGNHDGVVYKGETAASLDAFVANFCANAPAETAASQGAVRTTMDQPGAYFTLKAPFVRFIGLYSNTSEGASEGVISNSTVGSAQLTFLTQQLTAAKADRASGQEFTLIIATHHPPFTGSSSHVPSPTMLQQIDDACTSVGIWPDLHLSGHSHEYERYTRTVGGKQIAYVVAGMGGYYDLPGLKAKPPAAPTAPQSGTDAAGNPLTLEVFNDSTFGFLRMTASAASISVDFVTVDTTTGATGSSDTFTVNLTAGTVANASVANNRGAAKIATKPNATAKKATTAATAKAVATKKPVAKAKSPAKKFKKT
jgi:hypothetical protein